MRDNFDQKTKDILAKRVGFRCSNPNCRQLTSGPNSDPNKSVNIGVASHISAASEGGPRYDANITTEQRKAVANGIWLCPKCATLIDVDIVRYSIPVLRGWKNYSELLAKNEIEYRGQSKARHTNSASNNGQKGCEISALCSCSVENSVFAIGLSNGLIYEFSFNCNEFQLIESGKHKINDLEFVSGEEAYIVATDFGVYKLNKNTKFIEWIAKDVLVSHVSCSKDTKTTVFLFTTPVPEDVARFSSLCSTILDSWYLIGLIQPQKIEPEFFDLSRHLRGHRETRLRERFRRVIFIVYNSVKLNSSGTHFIATGNPADAVIISTLDGNLTSSLEFGASTSYHSSDFGDDFVALGTGAGSVYIFPFEEKKNTVPKLKYYELFGDYKRVHIICISPQNDLIFAATDDGLACCIESRTEKIVFNVTKFGNNIAGICWTNNGASIIVVTETKIVYLTRNKDNSFSQTENTILSALNLNLKNLLTTDENC
jgi:WD40 repeat protein